MQYLIPILVLLPLLSGIVVLWPGRWMDDRKNIWTFTLCSTLVTFAVSLFVAFKFNWAGGGFDDSFGALVPWATSLGLHFGYGIDAISLWLVLLTTFLMPLVILSSLSAITQRTREYYFWLLLLQAAMTGTFIATDIIFFYICFEFTLVPLFFLIGVFGGTNRLKAAKVFFFYTFTGSMLTFAGILYVAWHYTQMHQSGGQWSFMIADLYIAARDLSLAQQGWVLAALLAGFAVKVPLFPVHTWLPLAHTEAPTAGSVILAGVLLKLGTYGLLRFAIPMTPLASVEYAPAIAVLAIIGIIYTALICWVQKDVKKLIAYSSVSHLGFCVLGLFALDAANIGPIGAVMYMLNHGLSTGALFLCIGMIYERLHTREMAKMSGLVQVMPVWAFFTVFFVCASVGLPGLNGFIGEFMTLTGTFVSDNLLGWPYAAGAGTGMIFAAIYLLYMVGKVIFGPLKVPHSHGHDANWKPSDLNLREIVTLAPIAIACLVLGLAPYPILKTLEGPVAALTEHAQREVQQRSVQKQLNEEQPLAAGASWEQDSSSDKASKGLASR
jgi:NADH-quinone oxidoreductase subunit M